MNNPTPNQERCFSANDFDLSPEKATAVISAAQKFVIPVPDFGANGEDLVDPESGAAIRNSRGEPIGKTGIVFHSGAEKTLQAAPGDGSAVLIISAVTAVEAEALHDKIRSYTDNPNSLTLEQLKQVIEFAFERLQLQQISSSTRNLINAKMSPVSGLMHDDTDQPIECFGLMKRDDRDICYAVYVRGEFSFIAEAAAEGEKRKEFKNGAVILKQGDDLLALPPDEFARNYTFPDGGSISDPAALSWA